VAGYHEHNNENLESLEGSEFLDKLSKYKIIKDLLHGELLNTGCSDATSLAKICVAYS
jgi:hypothetical protein